MKELPNLERLVRLFTWMAAFGGALLVLGALLGIVGGVLHRVDVGGVVASLAVGAGLLWAGFRERQRGKRVMARIRNGVDSGTQ